MHAQFWALISGHLLTTFLHPKDALSHLEKSLLENFSLSCRIHDDLQSQ